MNKLTTYFNNLIKRWRIYRGKAIDIWSKNPYPANVLSNLNDNSFCFDGMECGSMEGFLQSLKYKDRIQQTTICAMGGRQAKDLSTSDWQTEQIVWWKGQAINRQSEEFLRLIRAAYQAMYEQNECFRTALQVTCGISLYHIKGEKNPFKTILTEDEFCDTLMWLRENMR